MTAANCYSSKNQGRRGKLQHLSTIGSDGATDIRAAFHLRHRQIGAHVRGWPAAMKRA
jgi:hypothetical protein